MLYIVHRFSSLYTTQHLVLPVPLALATVAVAAVTVLTASPAATLLSPIADTLSVTISAVTCTPTILTVEVTVPVSSSQAQYARQDSEKTAAGEAN